MERIRFEASVRGGITNRVAVIDLAGDITSTAEEALFAAYVAAVKRTSGGILLNFAGVQYIDSTGIALIVGLIARARQDGRAMTAFGLSDHYREIFEITRLTDYVGVFPSEASAAAAAVTASL